LVIRSSKSKKDIVQWPLEKGQIVQWPLEKGQIIQTMIYKPWTQKTKDWAAWTPQKTGGELRCSRRIRVRFMVFNAAVNNISVVSWRSVLLVEETTVPGEKHRPAASHWQTWSHNVVSSTPCYVSGDRHYHMKDK
jgi:hypothetical protein